MTDGTRYRTVDGTNFSIMDKMRMSKKNRPILKQNLGMTLTVLQGLGEGFNGYKTENETRVAKDDL